MLLFLLYGLILLFLKILFLRMNKLKKIIRMYCDFFDSEKINSTVLVWVIWTLIVWVWVLFKAEWTNAYLKWNLMEVNSRSLPNWLSNVIEINWVKYKLILEEIK